MAGWSTEFDWTVDGMKNAPTRAVLELYAATDERVSVSGFYSLNGTIANNKILRPRDYAYYVDQAMITMTRTYPFYYNHTIGAPDTLGDNPDERTDKFLNEETLNDLIGFERPADLSPGAPITAEWCVWMYKALNYMTEYGPQTFGSKREDRGEVDENTRSEYITEWGNEPWTEVSQNSRYYASSGIYSSGRYKGKRERIKNFTSYYDRTAPTIKLYMLWKRTVSVSTTKSWLGWESFNLTEDQFNLMDSDTSAAGDYVWDVVTGAPDDAPEGPYDSALLEQWTAFTTTNLALIDYSTDFQYT